MSSVIRRSQRPAVSVLMPSFQHEAYIADAMGSVLSQSFDDLELIVVDDGSTDGSRKIIRAAAEADGRVRPVFHESQRGIAHTFNDALAVARGRFVAVLASDDLWFEGKLARQMEHLERDETQVVWCEGAMLDETGRPTGKLAVADHINQGRATQKSGAITGEILRGGLILFAGLIARTTSVRELGFDPRMSYVNDIKLSLELARRYEYRFVPDVLCGYRWHAENSCKRKDAEGWAHDGIALRGYFLKEFASGFPPGTPQWDWIFGLTNHLIGLRDGGDA